MAEAGVAHEWLEAAECERRYPGIAAPGRALFQEDAGVCLADRTVAAQVALAAADGVDVREEVEVLALRPRDDGVAVDTSAGPIEAGVAVVTAGAWAQHVLDAPVTASLQTVAYFAPNDAAAAWPTFIEWEDDGVAWYAVPAEGEAPGVKVGEHRPGRRVDPKEGPFDAEAPTIERSIDFARRRLTGLNPEPRASEVCLYELTPDEHFILDRQGPVVVGAGGSGHGFKFAPLIGEVLADLAEGRDPSLPPGKFSLSRFEPAADVAG
jgi:sarcosine oxidase